MYLKISIPTEPTIIAVVVARAGIILPAINLTLNLVTSLILQFLALRLATAATNSICQLVGSSFSNSVGLIFAKPVGTWNFLSVSERRSMTYSSSSSGLASVLSLSSTLMVICFGVKGSILTWRAASATALVFVSYFRPKILAKMLAVDQINSREVSSEVEKSIGTGGRLGPDQNGQPDSVL